MKRKERWQDLQTIKNQQAGRHKEKEKRNERNGEAEQKGRGRHKQGGGRRGL